MKNATAFVITVLFLLCRCGVGPVGGGTTDTGNARVSATIYTSDGERARGAAVIIRSADYLKPFVLPKTGGFSIDLFTDDRGTFTVDSLPDGGYLIEVNDQREAATVFRIMVSSRDSAKIILSDTLKPYAGIEGSIGMAPPLYTYVQVVGMERSVAVDPSGRFIINDLPEGSYDIRIASYDSTFVPVALGVSCTSGVVTNLALAAWSYSLRIWLNTTQDGAAVAKTLTGFPVLVRLTADNFDFSRARADGADVRFAKADMTLLPHEIERWDPVAGYAELWVRADTIWGNSSNRYWVMYYGNPDVRTSSNGALVFDTADAFTGVWHLGEAGGTVDDATFFRNNGSRIGDQRRVPGVIGFAQSYTGQGDYSDMGDVVNPEAANITVSAWVKRADSGGTGTIIGKSSGDTVVTPFYGWLMTFNQDYLRFYVASGGEKWGDEGTFLMESTIKITDLNEWHFVCAVIDKSRNAGCRLYIDGVDVTRVRIGDITKVEMLSNTLPLRLGIEADLDFPFRGYIDEAVVSFVAHSEDWIKLSYHNQKPADRLLSIEK
jgi:hypothetical protein